MIILYAFEYIMPERAWAAKKAFSSEMDEIFHYCATHGWSPLTFFSYYISWYCDDSPFGMIA